MSNQTKQQRRVSSKKLRAILNEIADTICNAQERNIGLELSGRTISIRLDVGTVNITVNEARKGGNDARI